MYSELNQYNSPNYTPAAQCKSIFGLARTIDGITVHHWGDPNQNPSFIGVVNWLCNPNAQASAHAVCSGTNKQVAWLVNASDAAWHAGNAKGNATTIGIESDPRCRNEDYDVLAELIADIWIAYGKKLPLYPHRYWKATQCPGNYNMDRIKAEAEAWFARKTQPAPVITTQPVPAAKKLDKPVVFKATANPTHLWDLTTNPNYKSVKTLSVGEEFVAYAYIDFNNTKYYVTEYSFGKGLKYGVNTVDLMEQVTVPPVEVTPPKETVPDPIDDKTNTETPEEPKVETPTNPPVEEEKEPVQAPDVSQGENMNIKKTNELLQAFVDFMNGKKTWSGLVMIILGSVQIPAWLCGVLDQTACATEIVNTISLVLVIGGFALAAYGNWKSHKK